jgi:uroporphyrinogen-III decarboxylase
MGIEMTGKQRLEAALRGEPVDRVPIWLREGFPIAEPYPEQGDFAQGWMWDPLYRDLYREVAPYADPIRAWGPDGWTNRFLMVPPDRIRAREMMASGDLKRIEGKIDTPRGAMTYVDEQLRDSNTWWHVKTLVETVEDLVQLAEVPFELDPAALEPYITTYRRTPAEVGERGILRLGFSSPIVCISGCMKLETFLEMSITQKALFHELLGEITRRSLALIDALFHDRALDTTANLGGSEQCTPPLMTPQAFDEYVVPYDGPIVDRLHQYGVLVNCHCHGKVAYALRCIREIGFDSADPVEPPPAGDVSYAQARQIVDGRVTLIGNLEFDELCFADPAQIRERVREILALGKERLILGASAGPTSAVTPQLADNYRAMVETALAYG